MKSSRSILLALCMTGLVATAGAQGLKRHIADQYFKQLDYSRAAPIYDELAQLTVKGKKKSWDEVRLAAQSNMHSQNYKQAEYWYAQMDKGGQLTDDDALHYIEVLRSNEKYDDARDQMKKLAQKQPDNKWLQAYLQDPGYVSELKEDSALYKVKTLPFNSGLGEYSPAYYKDGLVYASRRRNSGFVNRKFLWDNSYFADLYYVTKKGKDNFAKRGKMMAKPFKSLRHDGPVAFSHDGKTAIVTQNYTGSVGKGEQVKLALYMAKVDDKGKWSSAGTFPHNSKDYSVGHPSLSKDGSTLYFASDMPGGMGGADIYKSTLSNGTWSAPVNLGPGVNTPGNELFPFIADDGALYFASTGHVGLGGLDIFKSTADFSSVENMGYPVNTSADDFGLIVSEEGNLGYFTSNRGDRVDRIYETTIKVAEFYLDGMVVMDDCNNTPVTNQEVMLTNTTHGTSETLTTDASGKFTVKLKKNSSYTLTTSRQEYRLLSEGSASTMGKLQSERYTATLELAALKIPVTFTTTDKANGQKLADVKVKITRKSDGQSQDLVSDAEGKITMVLDRNEQYTVDYHVHGYLEHTSPLSTSDLKCKNEFAMDLPLEKIKKGDVFVINNILYDYDSANLRVESEGELDKLAVFLMENNNIKVELSSHTDSRGGDSYNLKLSQKRAQSCVDYLIRKGVLKGNIVAKGYGETKLQNRCGNNVECSEEEHQQNRRTEIKILQVK